MKSMWGCVTFSDMWVGQKEKTFLKLTQGLKSFTGHLRPTTDASVHRRHKWRMCRAAKQNV